MTENSEDVEATGLYVIRFLNTQLKGCEYQITEVESHFFVGPQEDLYSKQELLISPGNIFIPDQYITAIFDIRVDADSSEPVIIGVSHAPGEKTHLAYQHVHSYAGVNFALRKLTDEGWSDEVENFNPSVATAEPRGVVKSNKTLFGWVNISVFILLICAFAGFTWFHYNNEEGERNTLLNLMGGDQQSYFVSRGQDAKWYIFTENRQEHDWVLRAIQKSGNFDRSVVISKRDERLWLANEISVRWPTIKFHLIRLDDPENPEVVLSKERGAMVPGSDAEFKALQTGLLNLLPYAKKIHFSTISDEIVARQAEQGLKKIAAIYSKKKQSDSLTFTFRGSLNDNELNTLKLFITNFNVKWQGNYARFEVELENDWLKGKSYQYGADGYIKLTPKHWQFPVEITR